MEYFVDFALLGHGTKKVIAPPGVTASQDDRHG
jgi:hypothetical protein